MRLELHPKQSLAFKSNATEILYGGAAGGGKSHLMRVCAIAWCVDIPGIQVYLFRRTYPDLWKNHMEGPSSFPSMLGEWIASGFVKLNLSDGQVIFSTHLECNVVDQRLDLLFGIVEGDLLEPLLEIKAGTECRLAGAESDPTIDD